MDYTITALKVQQRDRNRVNVYLDGEFAFGLARIVAAWLSVGQVIDDARLAELRSEDTREKAYQQALKFLNYRQRSKKEVQRNLEEHKYEEAIVQEVLEKLSNNGLLDDSRFAQNWVENRSEFQPRSKKALSIELRMRGLDDQTIQEAVEAIDDEELAYQAGVKQARKLRELDWMQFRQKMSNFLLRRGFHYEVISPVVRKIWDERNNGEIEGG